MKGCEGLTFSCGVQRCDLAVHVSECAGVRSRSEDDKSKELRAPIFMIGRRKFADGRVFLRMQLRLLAIGMRPSVLFPDPK